MFIGERDKESPRQRIHNTLIVVDRYLRLIGDKTIPDSAEPRLESFYPPFVAGIDLPHQGVQSTTGRISGRMVMCDLPDTSYDLKSQVQSIEHNYQPCSCCHHQFLGPMF